MKKTTRKIQTQRTRTTKTTTSVFSVGKFLRGFAVRFLVFALVIGLNWHGLAAIGSTFAYFNDTESSSENSFGAGSLDFVLTSASYGDSIGLVETVSFSSILLNSGSIGWQYTVEAEKISGDDDFCSALDLEAELNGSEKHDDSILSLDVPVATTIGTWAFDITLPVGSSGVSYGDTCEVDFVFKGWQTEIPLYEDSGFTDEERINVTLTARMIVLNEFLPRPDGEAYGFDFGDDSSDMPQGEWVEIYNNSDSSYDLDGWYVWDASGAEANKILVTSTNTDLATTVIPGKDWLVVYMNKAVLNNDGDTVKLYDPSDSLVDSHTYTANDFCEIEPTPGDDNSTTVSGSCGGVPPNKSYARIPDGIGGWVDPIPTPGGRNRLVTADDLAGSVSVSSAADPDPVDPVVDDPIVDPDPVVADPVDDPIVDPITDPDPVDPVVDDPIVDPVVDDPVDDPVEIGKEPEPILEPEPEPALEPEPPSSPEATEGQGEPEPTPEPTPEEPPVEG